MNMMLLTPEHHLWQALIDHLQRVDMARWVMTSSEPHSDTYILGAVVASNVIGHIALKRREMMMPATEWSQNRATALKNPDGTGLFETFVNKFCR